MLIIGQERPIQILRLYMLREDNPNILLRAPFGHGKTEIAKWYANSVAGDRGWYYEICAGKPVFPPDDGKLCLLDEIHNLRPEEVWYQYEGVIVGCTTEGSPMSDPMRSRFNTVRLVPYSNRELGLIAQVACPSLPEIPAQVIAERCRGTPRVAVQLAHSVNAWAKYQGYWPSTRDQYVWLLKELGYYEGGFTSQDKLYIEFVRDRQPVSLNNIMSGLNIPRQEVTEEIEPFLIRKNLLSITSKGRSIVCGNQIN